MAVHSAEYAGADKGISDLHWLYCKCTTFVWLSALLQAVFAVH